MREALIAAVLTGLMILLFLGSWRSTLIVASRSRCRSCLDHRAVPALGETLNVMTLGGLALAVGILVDDATVAIENIHRNLEQRKPLARAILDGAQQIAVPAFVSTLCICIVFVPVVLPHRARRGTCSCRWPMAVVFAMLASYLLSRTLVPTHGRTTCCAERSRDRTARARTHVPAKRGSSGGCIARFNAGFERLREGYRGAAGAGRWRTARWLRRLLRGCSCVGSLPLVPCVGRDFFPAVDAGQIRLHVRAPPGTRIEETERIFGRVEDEIRAMIPARELATILDNIGLPLQRHQPRLSATRPRSAPPTARS